MWDPRVSGSLGRTEGDGAEQTPKPTRNWGSLFFTVLATVGGLHALLMLGLEGGRYLYTQREVARLEADIGLLQGETRALRAVAEHKNDRVFREQLARQRGFIYPDEDRVMTVTPR